MLKSNTEIERMYLSTTEASKIIGVTVHAIRKWIKEGKIQGRKIGGRWFVVRSELEVEDERNEDR